MFAEEHFAQALTGEEAGLRAFEFYFFEFLAALAIEFGRGEGRFASKFADELEERFGMVAQPGEGDGASVLTGADR